MSMLILRAIFPKERVVAKPLYQIGVILAHLHILKRHVAISIIILAYGFFLFSFFRGRNEFLLLITRSLVWSGLHAVGYVLLVCGAWLWHITGMRSICHLLLLTLFLQGFFDKCIYTDKHTKDKCTFLVHSHWARLIPW